MPARSATARNGDGNRGRPGTVRIIGGKWKGRKLRVANGVRPTPDRARETLFNWLASDVLQARVLDLFAGSGALGFEALSRGASHATLVDQDRATARLLRRHRDTLDGDAAVVCADAERWLAHCGDQRWDVVFLDPPFAFSRWPQLLQRVVAQLHCGGIVYVESDDRFDQVIVGAGATLSLRRRSSAGLVRYGLLERPSSASQQTI